LVVTLNVTDFCGSPPVCEWRADSAIDRVLLVRQIELRQTRDGTAYLRLTLADRSGAVPAVKWDAGTPSP
jgi:hypothetical protein